MPGQQFKQRIPALVQGISRQSPVVRFPGQVEDATNISFNVVDGARKRPGSTAMFYGNTDAPVPQIDEKWRMHKIERDDEEEYLILYTKDKDDLTIVDLQTWQVATFTEGSRDRLKTYLTGPSDMVVDDVRMVTISDATFVLNTTKTVQLDSTHPSPPSAAEEDKLDYTTMPVQLNRITKATSTTPAVFSVEWPNWSHRTRNEQVLTDFLNPSGHTSSDHADSGKFGLTFQNDYTDLPYEHHLVHGQLVKIEPPIQKHGQDVPPFMDFAQGSEMIMDRLQGNGLEPEDYDLGVKGLRAFPFGKVICSGGPLPERRIFIKVSTDIPMLDVEYTADPDGSSDAKIGVSLPGGVPLADTAWYDTRFGDTDLNPAPVFAKKNLKITDIGYYRDRLLIGSDEFVCFSQASDLFNFYGESMDAVVDSDPIEIQLAATDITLVDYLVPFNNSILVLTSAGQQFETAVSGIVAPDTVSINPSTRYETQDVRPVIMGNKLFMAGKSQGFSTIWEYVYNEATAGNSAVSLTTHVADLLPKTILAMDTSASQNTLVVLPAQDGDNSATARSAGGVDHTGAPATFSTAATWVDDASLGASSPRPGDPLTITAAGSGKERIQFTGYATDPRNATSNPAGISSAELFVYKTFKRGNDVVQQAWTKWNFGSDAIMDVKIIDDEMYILRRYSDGTNQRLAIDKIDLDESHTPAAGENRSPFLDHNIKLANGARSGSAGAYTYTFTLPSNYRDDDINAVVFPTDGVEYAATVSGALVTVANVALSYGATGVSAYVGRKVKADITLSEVFMRDQKGTVVGNGKCRLMKMVVDHTGSRDYDVDVTSDAALCPDRKYSFTSSTVDTGQHHVMLTGRSNETTLKLTSDNTYPVTWTALEYHGQYDANLE